jgi:hypothetical protein
VTLHLNTNGMWTVGGATHRVGTDVPTAHRAALGGISFTASDATSFTHFAAQQDIGKAQLSTTQSTDSGGLLKTLTYMHPESNVAVTNVTWSPGRSGDQTEMLDLVIRTWVPSSTSKNFTGKNQYGTWDTLPTDVRCCDAKGFSQPCATNNRSSISGSGSGRFHCVSRNASSNQKSIAKMVWATIVTKIEGGSFESATTINETFIKPNQTVNDNPFNFGCLTVDGVSSKVHIAAGQVLSITTAVGESKFNTSHAQATSVDPTPATAELAFSASAAGTARAASTWWQHFWNKSSISLPSQPYLEVLWYGALYATAAFASYDSAREPSGLYGPFVTSDYPQWYGDFTLDYNQEAQFFHVHKANHQELARTYYGSISAWIPGAQAIAAELAGQANFSCPANAHLYPCHIAPWGFQSVSDDSGRFWVILFG